MKPYPADLRERVLADCDGGLTTRAAAAQYRVSESWVRRVKQERRELGKVEPKLTRNRTPDWAAHADWLRAKVAQQPDATLLELVALAAAEREWITSDATICRALQALRLTRKKRRSSRASKIARTSPSAAPHGSRRKRTSIRRESFFSTKRGPRRT